MKRYLESILILTLVLAAATLFVTACGESGDDEGAPSIPHSVTSTSDEFCLSCHEEGVNGAPKTPHPGRTNCVGCHEPQE